ncbi:UTRA domain-containing protein [Szabonella alba]|uniref:UTRA domain-containing protein n=1 Tax=Szabonella alba TaxID=2804194 RepID=A0A8K0VC17_9RHOB|nr:UTRA domain-containing protein [Szabonella alba]MBL4916405.1 UTRA domain-containing protein [Szabonella alba]
MSSITWQTVQAEALRRIRTREWPPGSRIPDEAVLAAELGCARATVNRALRELAEAGLLERRRKAGTRVPLNPVRKATFEVPIIRQDIEGRGLVPGYRLLTRAVEPAPAALLASLPAGSLPPGAQLLRLRALHLAGDAPFCLEERWVNPLTAPGILVADLDGISANEWLVQNTSFTGGDIAFGATNADAETAAALDCPPGASLFVIDRMTRAGEALITSVRLSYAPGYQMQAVI